MARKRTTSRIKRVTRYVSKKVKSYGRSNPYTPANLRKVAVGSAIYGAFREDLSGLVSQVAGNIPVIGNIVGTFGDEAVLGVGGYFIAKKMKGKMAKALGLSMMAVEASRAGAAIRQGGFNFGSAPKATGTGIFG